MPKNRSSAPSKVTRLQAQTRAICCVNGVLLCVCGMSLGALAVASALPQKRQLHEKERELQAILEREKSVVAVKEDREASYEALKDDREFLELHARDRLNLYQPGEMIYRIERQR